MSDNKREIGIAAVAFVVAQITLEVVKAQIASTPAQTEATILVELRSLETRINTKIDRKYEELEKEDREFRNMLSDRGPRIENLERRTDQLEKKVSEMHP